jgi:hypothetical protein
MTRRSKRELERALAELADDAGADPTAGTDVAVSWADYETDTGAGGELPERYTVVMRREDAEREGREILGPADGTGDLVRVDT